MIQRICSEPLRSDPPPRPVSILIVDDTEPIVQLLTHFLDDIVDEIAVAHDGVEAVEAVIEAAAARRPFDLVLMDLQMPRLSGLDAARRIRARGIDVPLIAMTAGGYERPPLPGSRIRRLSHQAV